MYKEINPPSGQPTATVVAREVPPEALSITYLIELEGDQKAHLVDARQQLGELYCALIGLPPNLPEPIEAKTKGGGVLEKLKTAMADVSNLARFNLELIAQIKKTLGV